MSDDALYWLASTVAQSVVALLAFASFVAVWRREVLWNRIKDRIDWVHNECHALPGRILTRKDEEEDERRLRDYLQEIGRGAVVETTFKNSNGFGKPTIRKSSSTLQLKLRSLG